MHELLQAFVAVILGGFYFSLFLFAPLWAPNFVLKGLTRQESKPTNRYSTTDAIVLITQIAFVCALLAPLYRKIPDWNLAGLTVLAVALAMLIWLKCTTFMAKNGITEVRCRVLFQMVVYPFTVAMPAIIIFCCLILVGLVELLNDGIAVYFSHPLVQSALATLPLAYTCTKLLRWSFSHFVLSPEMQSTR